MFRTMPVNEESFYLKFQHGLVENLKPFRTFGFLKGMEKKTGNYGHEFFSGASWKLSSPCSLSTISHRGAAELRLEGYWSM